MLRHFKRNNYNPDLSVRFRRYRRVCITVLIILAVNLSLYEFCIRVFRIRTIEIVGNGVTVMIDGHKIPSNLLFFPVETIRKALITEYPQLADVTITRRFPHTIRFAFQRRHASARIMSEVGEMAVATDGMILGPAVAEDMVLPMVYFTEKDFYPGKTIQYQEVIDMLEMADELNKHGRLTEIKITNERSYLAKYEDIDILITQNASPALTADTLQTLLTGFRMKSKVPTRIDLRFQKPVIIY